MANLLFPLFPHVTKLVPSQQTSFILFVAASVFQPYVLKTSKYFVPLKVKNLTEVPSTPPLILFFDEFVAKLGKSYIKKGTN